MLCTASVQWPENSLWHWNMLTQVKITTGGEVSSDCKDQPPAGFPAQYCTMMKGMGSCANVGQHENMLTQCPVTCGFCTLLGYCDTHARTLSSLFMHSANAILSRKVHPRRREEEHHLHRHCTSQSLVSPTLPRQSLAKYVLGRMCAGILEVVEQLLPRQLNPKGRPHHALRAHEF